MSEEIREYIKQWLLKANEDINLIKFISEYQPEMNTSATCFHAQQAVEKFLKAFLVYNKINIAKTHDVDYLLAECIKIDKAGFDSIELKEMNEFAVDVRYPDVFFTPSLAEAKMYCEIAFEVKDLVESKIKLIKDNEKE